MDGQKLSILLLNHTWLAADLRALGHFVVTAAWNSPESDINYSSGLLGLQDLLDRMPAGFVPDRIVYYDNSRPFNILDFAQNQIPSLFFSVDAHHHFAWHPFVSAMFDKTLVAQPDYLPHFAQFDPQAAWFPLWATQDAQPQPVQDIDVCFRGNLEPKQHPKRAVFFEKLGKLINIDSRGGYYLEPFCRSKIVVNHTVKGDLNFRVFEAMMCGALVVTPAIQNGQPALFEDGKDLITYASEDADDAANKIRYYLEHEEERRRIAENGRNKVLAHHSTKARARDLEKLLLELQVRPKPKRFIGAAVTNISGAETTWNTNRDIASLLLAASAAALVQSASAGEGIDEGVEANIMLVKIYLELLEQREFADKLVDQLLHRYSNNIVLTLLKMESLLRAGREPEALELAANVSHIPNELIGAVIGLVDRTRREIIERRIDSGMRA